MFIIWHRESNNWKKKKRGGLENPDGRVSILSLVSLVFSGFPRSRNHLWTGRKETHICMPFDKTIIIVSINCALKSLWCLLPNHIVNIPSHLYSSKGGKSKLMWHCSDFFVSRRCFDQVLKYWMAAMKWLDACVIFTFQICPFTVERFIRPDIFPYIVLYSLIYPKWQESPIWWVTNLSLKIF